MLALPKRRTSNLNTFLSFVLLVVIPTLAAAWYYTRIASNQYVSQFRFAVTETNTSPQGTLAGGIAGALGGMGGATQTQTQNYLVTDYLTSPQLVDELEKRVQLSERFSRPGIDWLWRYDRTQPIEALVRYWQQMIDARYDPITGLASAEIRAFNAEDAQLIASTVVRLSEDLVNTISMRSKNDSVRFASTEVERAENRLRNARAALTDFRMRENLIDPTSGLVPSNVQQVATVRGSLIQLQTELAALSRQNLRPGAPAELTLRARIAATQEQLTSLEREVANQRGQAPALASVVGRFEQLTLERDYAQAMVVSTNQALDTARASAGSQQLYLTPYVRPALPTSPQYPRRVRSILLTALACIGIWLLLLMVWKAVREVA